MDILVDKRVKARKEHTCDFCNKKIPKGEEYRYSKIVNGGDLYSWHSCDRCKEYVTKAFKELGDWASDGLTEEMFKEFMYENYEEVAKEWWG